MLINYSTKHFLFVTEPFNSFNMAALNDHDHKACTEKTRQSYARNSKLKVAG
jgi:hypothetical protein